MSMDKAFRELIQDEVERHLKPLREMVSRLESGTEDLEELKGVVNRLAPLADLFGAGLPAPRAAKPAGRPAGRPGRPPKAAAPAAPAPVAGKRRGRKPGSEKRVCAIIGCGKPSRTKGYCAAHYQKLRMLEKTGRRPAAWVDHAEPASVEDIKLPRGRAAAKALAEAAKASA